MLRANTRRPEPIEPLEDEGAVSDAPGSPERTVKDIVPKEVDREIIQVAARLFMALEPGETRETAAQEFVQNYRDNLAGAHTGVDPDVLHQMTINYAAALMLEMERIGLAAADDEAVPAKGKPR